MLQGTVKAPGSLLPQLWRYHIQYTREGDKPYFSHVVHVYKTGGYSSLTFMQKGLTKIDNNLTEYSMRYKDGE